MDVPHGSAAHSLVELQPTPPITIAFGGQSALSAELADLRAMPEQEPVYETRLDLLARQAAERLQRGFPDLIEWDGKPIQGGVTWPGL